MLYILAPFLAAWSEDWPARRLKAGFGLVVLAGALMVIFRDHITGGMAIAGDWQTAYLILVGIIEGAVAGIIGISGGPVLAPISRHPLFDGE